MDIEAIPHDRSSTVFISLIAVSILIIYNLLSNSNARILPHIPYHYRRFGSSMLGKWRFLIKGRKMMEEGYDQHRGIFQMTTQNGALVMLSHEHMAELLRQPDDVIDMVETVRVEFETDLTKLTPYQPIVPHTIRAHLTPAMARIIPRMWPEIEKTVNMYIPLTDDWSTVKVADALTPVVAVVAGSAFVGNELCYKQEWIKPATGYTVDVMGASMELKLFPGFVRSYAADYLPRIRRANQYRTDIRKWLGPHITKRRQLAEDPKAEVPDDMLQWMIEKREEFNIETDEDMAAVQLGVALVSIHSTSITTTQAVYNLVAHPEYLEPLREEISKHLFDENGNITKNTLYECKLLDSFLKESARMNPIVLVVGKRVIRKQVTLSDGTVLPVGTWTGVPSDAISHDPKVFENPKEFDGFRFARMRDSEKGGSSEKDSSANGSIGTSGGYNQLVTSNKTNLTFGFGRHSCPGRFFAAAEIKMIMAFIVMNYDFKFVGHVGRPKNLIFSDFCMPDSSVKVQFRKRSATKVEV